MFIYDDQDFWLPLCSDIQNARGSVKIHVPYITQSAMERWRGLIAERASAGVAFCVVIQKPRDWDKLARGALAPEAAAKMEQLKTLLSWVESLGVHVQLRERIHAKLIVIDEDILWEGSLNFLSHFDTTEHVRKSINRQEVLEVKRRHKLDDCEKCTDANAGHEPRLPQLIVLRRQVIGMSQGQLAKTVKIAQSQLSRMESGQIRIINSLWSAVLSALKLKIVVVPEHLCAPVEHFVRTAMLEASDRARIDSTRKAKRARKP